MTKVSEIMSSTGLTVLEMTDTAADAAMFMKENDIGDVLVGEDGRLRGIVTDRDIVVRVIAEGLDATTVKLQDICSKDMKILGPDDTIEDALALMSEEAIRRLPIVDNGTPVGIITLGDLSEQEDVNEALADVSSASPTA